MSASVETEEPAIPPVPPPEQEIVPMDVDQGEEAPINKDTEGDINMEMSVEEAKAEGTSNDTAVPQEEEKKPDEETAPKSEQEEETTTSKNVDEVKEPEGEPEEPPVPTEAELEKQREEDNKRRREVLDNMVSIEAEFSALKERLFSEKIRETQREVDMVKNETHEEFLEQVRRLQHIREQKVATAERWRKYQLQTIQELYDAEKRMVNSEFDAEKGILRDRLLTALTDKRRKLEEEKHTLNLTDNDVGTESRALKRSLRRRDRDSGDGGAYVRAYPGEGLPPPSALGMSSAVTSGPSLGLGGEGGAAIRRMNKPPHVSYALREQEVLEDLAQINMDLGARRSTDARPSFNIDVHIDRGYLYYGDQVFEKGMTVDIEGPTNSRGIIWSIDDAEIGIRFPDDKRGTIYTPLLRTGKYVLHAV